MKPEDFYPREVRDESFWALVEAARERGLDENESRAAMAAMAEGRPSAYEIAALLLAPSMSAKEASAETMYGLAEEVRARALRIEPKVEGDLADTCGTGGGYGTFNVSTAAALLLAAEGVPVAKHGNRAIASRSGSADVLEALGVPVEQSPQEATEQIERLGFGFLFAPKFHRAFASVMPVRKRLAQAGIRTAFNCIGPLANPADVGLQVVGVYEADLGPRAAEVLARRGTRAFVVHGRIEGRDGALDEISTLGPTRIWEVAGGKVAREFEVSPEDLGLSRAAPEDVAGGTVEENAARLRRILAGEGRPAEAELVAASAGAALVLAGEANDLAAGIARAKEALASGRGAELLAALSA